MIRRSEAALLRRHFDCRQHTLVDLKRRLLWVQLDDAWHHPHVAVLAGVRLEDRPLVGEPVGHPFHSPGPFARGVRIVFDRDLLADGDLGGKRLLDVGANDPWPVRTKLDRRNRVGRSDRFADGDGDLQNDPRGRGRQRILRQRRTGLPRTASARPT